MIIIAILGGMAFGLFFRYFITNYGRIHMKKTNDVQNLSGELQYWENRKPNNTLIKSIKQLSVKKLKEKIKKQKTK